MNLLYCICWESIVSNGCDAVGNGYRGQTAAIIESIFINACDAVGNGYRGAYLLMLVTLLGMVTEVKLLQL